MRRRVRAISFIGSHDSGQGLQLREGCLIADTTVFASLLGGDECRLGIDYFEYCGFAASVAKHCKAKALGSCGYAFVQRGELSSSSLRLRIGLIQLCDCAALGCSERRPCCVAPDFALPDFVCSGKPVPHG